MTGRIPDGPRAREMSEPVETDVSTRGGRLRSSSSASRWRLGRVDVALFFFVLVVAAPVVHPYGEQQASRYALTAALWDEHTVVIDDYASMLGRDSVVFEGSTYSDKAPGQPFLMVPVYGIYRLLGGESPVTGFSYESDVGTWWLTIWSAAVPAAILAVMMYRWAREVESKTSLLATLTLAVGSLLLVYSTLLFGHVLAALFAFGMFLLIRKEGASWPRLLCAGLLGGAAVITEYPLALVVAVLTLAAAIRHRSRVLAVVTGGVPFVVLLGIYNQRLFGDPLTLTYQWSSFGGPRQEANEFLGYFAGPTFERFLHVLVSPRGLLIATPIVLIALLGFLPMWRRGWRFDVLVASCVFLGMLAVPASWANSYAGGAGPRYLIPALPFLVAPLAVAWTRWRILAWATAAISVVTMVAATLTQPQLPTQFEGGLRYWFWLLSRGDLGPSIYSVALGGWGWLLYLGGIFVAGYFLWRAAHESNENDVRPGSLTRADE